MDLLSLSPTVHTVLSVVPLIGGLTVVATVARCYSLCAASGRLPPQLKFPAISAVGMRPPEQTVYQVGFSATGLIILASVFLFERYLAPHYLTGLPDEAASLSEDAMYYGSLASVGVILQGLFTLSMSVGHQSIIHWGGAGVFAWGGINHCNAVVQLMARSLGVDEGPDGGQGGTDRRGPAPLAPPTFSPVVDAHRDTLLLSLSFKNLILKAPMVMFVLPLVFQFFQAASAPPGGKTGERAEDEGGQGPPRKMLQALPIKDLRSRLSKLGAKCDDDGDSPADKSAVVNALLAAAAAQPEVYAGLYPFTADGQDQQAMLERGIIPVSGDGSTENMMGAMQWIMVGMFVLFFGSYSLDMFVVTASPYAHLSPDVN